MTGSKHFAWSPRVSRRQTLGAATGVLAAGVLPGCDLLSTQPESDEGGARSRPEKGPEAPMLATRVEDGDLPPVEDRLPASPQTVQPVDRIGQYGGRWRGIVAGPSQAGYLYCVTGYENLVKWAIDYAGEPGLSKIEPNVAEDFEVSDDGTEYTFQLRSGLRWSDGEPFTADDVVFAIEDIHLNTEVSDAPPGLLLTDTGEPASIHKIDDHAFSIVFPSPTSLFLRHLATVDGHVLTHFPRHHLERYLSTYNPNVDELVEEGGFADRMELFAEHGGAWNWGQTTEVPTLHAWRLTQPFGESNSVRFERNPYYWKVDPDGSQLPYIDEIILDIVDDPEVMQLRAANGEVDLEAGPDTRFTTVANKPVLARARAEGDFRFLDVRDERSNVLTLHFNRNHKDPALREVFDSLEFRIGLSHAINREEIIDATMQRQGEPYQMAPNPESPYYDEEFATQYTEYDVDLANQYLDQAGYTERDEDGTRLGPDGSPIAFQVAIVSGFRPEYPDMLELIRDYWREVGIEMTVDSMDRSLWSVRRENNDDDVATWTGDGGLDVPLNPNYYAPTAQGSLFASLWGNWYETRGEEGEEPPEAAKRQLELLDQVKATTDVDEQRQLLDELLQIAREEFYVLGIARETEKYFLASNRFHNVPDPMLQGWYYPTPGPTETCQYFIAEPE